MRLVLFGRTAGERLRETLRSLANVELVEADNVAGVIDELPRADGLILSDPRGQDGVRLAQALHGTDNSTRWIQMISAGHAGLTDHPLPSDVTVTGQGGVAAPAVAEHAVALIMALNRGIAPSLAAQRDGHWEQAKLRSGLHVLEGATVVIVGLGHVGRTLAQMLAAFGATLIGVNRGGASQSGFDRTFAMRELDAALGRADVVALCLPASPETSKLFDHRRFAAIKRGAILVNVGRGEIVVSDALAGALMSGHLRGAAIDVVDPEPLPDGHSLWHAPNLIITPHIAGGGNPLSGRRMARMVADNVERFASGEPLLNQIHPEARP